MIPGTALVWLAAMARAVAGAGTTLLAGLLFWALVPLAAGWHTDVILSGSMQPQICAGDLVLVASAAGPVRPGQVIEFTDPAQPQRQLVHRVVSRNADGTLTTRGDANRGPDSTTVPPADVHGLARLRIPWLGLPVFWLRQHTPPSPATVLMLCGYLAALLPYGPRRVGRHRGQGRAARRSHSGPASAMSSSV